MELIQEADRSKWMVHMKRFIRNVKENFAKELIVHREINHKNVVRLIGCCEEENALMLVTEYIANGNLSDFLHNNNGPIPFDVRLRIAIECAEALAYMHSHMYTQVIRGDIKPGNILLDSNFHAKLSDFGISRLVNTDKTLLTKSVIGSIGYMDPLFARDGCLTVKSDVYSFGVVLLELIARKKAIAVVDNVNIVSAFTNALASGVKGVRGMFDAEIASKDNMKILERVAKLAGECLTMERGKRPEMVDVMERLRILRKDSYQDQGQRVDLFSWVRKSKPTPTAAATIVVPAEFSLSSLCRVFSLEEMKAATNNFDWSLLVGEGAFGSVYHGKINGGETIVAIKRHNWDPLRGERDFRTVIEMSSKHPHHNVLPLVGYHGYFNGFGEMILVYDYMAHGCFRDHLCRTKQPPLTWNRRLEICIGAARGLHCLHTSQIIHGNVNTKKILLNENWVAKINLSLSKSLPYSEESDVYSFGVVLFAEEGKLDQIIDPYLMGRINPRCLDKFIETAEKCVAERGIDRPSMVDVVSDLEHALQFQVGAEASGGLAGSTAERRHVAKSNDRYA
ncbi:hypothetical protein SETIT_9G382300v2 [Setaria italica]|uniref:Protein kinase domain-containing protein n=1 Tax=Setaria italica TaxID=4555 RepID=A0A368SS19_SETIT|nr:hypothetical protein SETIT_9G382300v2 [Setaria italica]